MMGEHEYPKIVTRNMPSVRDTQAILQIENECLTSVEKIRDVMKDPEMVFPVAYGISYEPEQAYLFNQPVDNKPRLLGWALGKLTKEKSDKRPFCEIVDLVEEATVQDQKVMRALIYHLMGMQRGRAWDSLRVALREGEPLAEFFVSVGFQKMGVIHDEGADIDLHLHRWPKKQRA